MTTKKTKNSTKILRMKNTGLTMFFYQALIQDQLTRIADCHRKNNYEQQLIPKPFRELQDNRKEIHDGTNY